MELSRSLVEIRNLRIGFYSHQGCVQAVDGVSLVVPSGGSVGLVGESGCGKTLTALAIAKLIPQVRDLHIEGQILFEGRSVFDMSESELSLVRGGKIAYVFQEAGAALNPTMRIGRQIAEAIAAHRRGSNTDSEVHNLLRQVGIPDPSRISRCYPHELSGGMQQRVMIAMAVASRPKLLVADEPTTALDVTIQAQILELIKAIQRSTGMALLLITHNLGLVADSTDLLAVMYAGRILEWGLTEELLTAPAHPYTAALLKAAPQLSSTAWRAEQCLESIRGVVPSPAQLPVGCKFAPRCCRARPLCHEAEPDLSGLGGPLSSGSTPVEEQPDKRITLSDRRRVRCWHPLSETDG